jgi:hypothetical protein
MLLSRNPGTINKHQFNKSYVVADVQAVTETNEAEVPAVAETVSEAATETNEAEVPAVAETEASAPVETAEATPETPEA